jgi:hypothetical protein
MTINLCCEALFAAAPGPIDPSGNATDVHSLIYASSSTQIAPRGTSSIRDEVSDGALQVEQRIASYAARHALPGLEVETLHNGRSRRGDQAETVCAWLSAAVSAMPPSMFPTNVGPM